MNSLKSFFAGLFAASIAIVVFILTGRMKYKVDSKEDKAEVKLKEIEAHNEVEKSFEGLSDDDIVLNAVNDQHISRHW